MKKFFLKLLTILGLYDPKEIAFTPPVVAPNIPIQVESPVYFEVLLLLTKGTVTVEEVYLVEAATSKEALQLIEEYFMASRVNHEVISVDGSDITTVLEKY